MLGRRGGRPHRWCDLPTHGWKAPAGASGLARRAGLIYMGGTTPIRRMFTAALVAAFVVPGAAHAAPSDCPTVRDHNHALRAALTYSNHGGDYHASRPARRQFERLGSIRSCLKHTDRDRYRLARGAWTKRAARWAFHRHIDQITPHGKWAIPEYIVMRESGGNRCAMNPTSTAGGYYQFIDSTWTGYGGTAYARSHPAACAPDWEQHEVAARAWAGGSGSSHWALTR